MQVLHGIVESLVQILRDPLWGSLGVIASIALPLLTKERQAHFFLPPPSQKIC